LIAPLQSLGVGEQRFYRNPPLICANPLPVGWCKKKTGLVGPASRGVELRCGYITAQRELT